MSEMMTLGEKQELFARLFIKLIQKVYDLGMTCRIGEVFRSDEQAEINSLGVGGRKNLCRVLEANGFKPLADAIANNTGSGVRPSVHELKIAVDLLLFKNGIYLTDSEAYRILGEYWESLHPLCRNGRSWNDGNHFSLEHQGKK